MSSQIWLFYCVPSLLKDNIQEKSLRFTYIKGSSQSYFILRFPNLQFMEPSLWRLPTDWFLYILLVLWNTLKLD